MCVSAKMKKKKKICRELNEKDASSMLEMKCILAVRDEGEIKRKIKKICSPRQTIYFEPNTHHLNMYE